MYLYFKPHPRMWQPNLAMHGLAGSSFGLLGALTGMGGPPMIAYMSHTDTTEPIEVVEGSDTVGLRRGDLSVSVDRANGLITDLVSTDFTDGAIDPRHPLGGVHMTKDGREEWFDHVVVETATEGRVPSIAIRREGADGTTTRVTVSVAPEIDAVDIRFACDELPQPDGGMNAALQTTMATRVEAPTLVHNHPYGVSEIRAEGTYQKKYPTGDWMNSPQYFEDVVNPFTSLSLLDMGDARRGVLFVHDGSQQMRRDGSAVHAILSMRDPWDGDYWVDEVDSRWRVIPHGPTTNAERWRLAQEFLRPVLFAEATGSGGDLPASFGTIFCDAPGVAVTALFRDGGEQSDAILDGYEVRPSPTHMWCVSSSSTAKPPSCTSMSQRG